MTRQQPFPTTADARLAATLRELDAPTRVTLVARAVVHAAALRVVAWTAPAPDRYAPTHLPRLS